MDDDSVTTGLLVDLIAQMSALTHALYEMAQSNMALVEAMAQADDAGDDDPIPQAMSRKR